MNIMAIFAHPDDIELNCAGTLALYAKQEHNVTMAIFTKGNMGDMEIKPDELAKIRRKEAQDSADVIGAKLLWGDIDDQHVFPNEYQRAVMIDLLRQVDPDVIFTHSPNDYPSDHRYVSQLAIDAYGQKGLPHIPNQEQLACRFGQTQIYYTDIYGGVGFDPTDYVDITEVIETKKQMLNCHESQIKPMKKLANIDMLQMLDTQTRFRGLAANCEFAEAFVQMKAAQRGLTKRILP